MGETCPDCGGPEHIFGDCPAYEIEWNPTEPAPPQGADRFCDENGKDWFWTGAYTREQVLAEFCNDEDDPPEVTIVRGRIEVEPGEVSDEDARLYVDPDGPWSFWQVEGGVY